MKYAGLRFYEELNDFLPSIKRKKRYDVEFSGTPGVKDIIEAQGVPHTEVDLILVNSKPVSFKHKLKGGEEISVYPQFESFNIAGVQKLRPKPLRRPKFILDVHLGTLAKYMRMLGFDLLYENNYCDPQIIEIALKEKRTILTRDLGIQKYTRVTRGYWVRNSNPVKQIEEIVDRFDLSKEISPFTRCVRCNSKLKKVKKENVISELPPKVKESQTEFNFCNKCGKIYWKGSHYISMKEFIEKLSRGK